MSVTNTNCVSPLRTTETHRGLFGASKNLGFDPLSPPLKNVSRISILMTALAMHSGILQIRFLADIARLLFTYYTLLHDKHYVKSPANLPMTNMLRTVSPRMSERQAFPNPPHLPTPPDLTLRQWRGPRAIYGTLVHRTTCPHLSKKYKHDK